MSDNVIKILPTELDGNSRYAIRVRTINSFGTVSEWSDSIIADTYDAGTSTGGKLVLTANGMIAYDPNGQTSLVYSGTNTASRTNFVVNPSFEINTNGWTALTSSAISRITTDFYVGEPAYKACLRVASSGATLKDVGFITAAANRTFSTSGRVYTASAYVKALVSQVSIKIGIVFYNSAGDVIKTVYSYSPRVVNADGLWARVSIIGTQAPNATASIGVIVASASAMTSGQAFLVDGVLGERSSTLGDYFDGSTSLGATKWNGTAHFSTSIFDFSSPYFVDGGVFTAGTLQTAVDVGVPQAASPYYGKAGVKMSTSGVQGYSGLQATPSFSLATDGKFRVGNLANYMYWDGLTLTIAGNLAAGVIDIGGFDNTSFHVDATGQMWMGAATYALAPLRISSTGTIRLTGSFGVSNSYMEIDVTTTPFIRYKGSGLATGGGISSEGNLLISTEGELNLVGKSNTNIGYIGSGATILVGDTIILSTANVSAYGSITFSASGYLTDASAVNNWFRPYDGANMHIKASTGSMYLDTDGIHYFRNIAGTNRMYIDTSGNVISSAQVQTKQFYSVGQSPTTSWDTAQFVADGVGSGNATMSTRTATYAGQIRQANSVNDWYIRNANDSNYIIMNVDVVDMSSRRYKRNIVPFNRPLSAGTESALSMMSKIEVITYKRNKAWMIPSGKDGRWDARRAAALARLNEMRQSKGLPDYELVHECGVHCESTPANPCQAMINEEKDLPGIIAEQINEVVPGCVHIHPETGQPEGVKTLSLLAVTIKALQEMKDLVESLEAKIAVLEK